MVVGKDPIIEKSACWIKPTMLPQTPSCNYNRFTIASSFIKLNLLPQNGYY